MWHLKEYHIIQYGAFWRQNLTWIRRRRSLFFEILSLAFNTRFVTFYPLVVDTLVPVLKTSRRISVPLRIRICGLLIQSSVSEKPQSPLGLGQDCTADVAVVHIPKSILSLKCLQTDVQGRYPGEILSSQFHSAGVSSVKRSSNVYALPEMTNKQPCGHISHIVYGPCLLFIK